MLPSGELKFGHRRLRFYAAFAALAPAHLTVTWICFLFDHLFFPRFRRVQIRAPLFILGNFRSGSTFLYRRLARDRRAFTAMSTREIYLTPSISQRKLWTLARSMDAAIGSPIRNYIHRFDDRVLEAVPYHKVGLSEPEEDEGLFFYRWAGFFVWFFFPKATRPLKTVSFDRSIGRRRRGSLMRFYRRCVQRHLYVHGVEKHYLSKNPASTGKLRSLVSHFPDARILCLVRAPGELVPSMVNWFSFAIGYFNDRRRRYLFSRRVSDMALFWYRYPLSLLDSAEMRARLRFLSFEVLTGDFGGATEELYRFLGVSGNPHHRGVVPQPEEVSERPRGLRPEDIGLSTREIEERFSATMDAYGALPPPLWIGGTATRSRS